ncbi:MAG: acyl-CoA dehydrogenase family protein [Polaromonas sp.]|uniref:acyl-CoA dehydrogenase family protein n=1 Tax=Polaromonas sp. TaxID=1869339 RepID=UPI003265C916
MEVLRAPGVLAQLPCFAECDDDLMQQILGEAGKFVAAEIAPLNRVGDEEGCVFQAGEVRTPAGFKSAYQSFWQAGWASLSCAPEDGGQGQPEVLNQVLYEMLSAANHGWTMAPGLLHGAYECLKHHGSEALKLRYLEKIASGEWLATMCLTEAHAGSDLGQVRTRGIAQPDGSYGISGTKIFISGGEHDLTANIIHLVLGRLPDAPAGPKGLSLFLVPKVLPDGGRNAVYCDRIEEKMGLHGSPTCVMRFESATGWLVGEAGRGLNAMFVMMNAARLHVGLQGVGLLDAAWQKADAYSKERRQMRAPGPRASTEPADLIAIHPAMRRILDTQRAWIDGGRVLAYRTALELDIARHHANAERRAQAERWCSLVTPVLKASLTQQAFYGGSECLQVFGGHGYVREWGVEQIVRDARVAMIYEGTNEIQAIDLLMRKVLVDNGAALYAFLSELCGALDRNCEADAKVMQFVDGLSEITASLVLAASHSVELPYWVADDYLRLVALLLQAWAWAKIDTVLRSGSAGGNIARWSTPSQALQHWVLPEFGMRLGIIKSRLAASAEPVGIYP